MNPAPRPDVSLRLIADEPGDLRFFIRAGGKHAGGITVHGRTGDSFSYGIAVPPALRGRGIASAALRLLFDEMRARGCARARVRIRSDNAASLALHRALGFLPESRDGQTEVWVLRLPPC